MGGKQDTINNVVITFIIGFVAGVSPFLFMHLLPRMLNPGIYQDTLSGSLITPIVSCGVIIGAITSIIFSRKFKDTEPKIIFFYALGIPAILIATVSNVSTKYNAEKQIDAVKDQATMGIVGQLPLPMPSSYGGGSQVVDPFSDTPKHSFLHGNIAWAEEFPAKKHILIAQVQTFLLVIGEYNNVDAARKDFKRYNAKKFRSERYFSKSLQILEFPNSLYVLVYSQYSTLAEAQMFYRIVRINDSELDIKIMKK